MVMFRTKGFLSDSRRGSCICKSVNVSFGFPPPEKIISLMVDIYNYMYVYIYIYESTHVLANPQHWTHLWKQF